MIVLIAVAAGYGTGALLALFLDRMYTGAPIRGPIDLCEHGVGPALLWTGTLGYVVARGRCSDGCALPSRLWYLPLVGAIAAVMIVLRIDEPRHAAMVALFSVVLLAFIGTDFESHLLPNRLMYPALALAVALSWAWPGHSANEMMTGGVLGFGLMFVLFIVLPGLGLGDVKLTALLGLLVGVSNLLPALAAGMIAGGIGSALMLATRRVGHRSSVAYGPYLALGAFLGMLTR